MNKDFDEEYNDEPELDFGVVDDPNKKKKKKKWLIILFWVLMILLFVLFSYLGYLKYKFNKMISGRKAGTIEDISNLSNPGNLRGESTGDVNILFVGMRGKDMAGAYLSSAMMVVNIDVKKNKMNLISVPRDLWVPIDGKYGKANSIYKTTTASATKYPDNGIPFIEKTFSDVLGIDINYAFICDFDSFEMIIDRIGKVNVVMSEEEAAGYPFLKYDLFSDAKDKTDPTLYHFNGEQSLVFTRWPEDAVPDFDRLRRMQLYLFSFTKQYMRLSSALNPAKNSEILTMVGDNIKIDMQLWEVPKIASLVNNIPAENISQHKLTTDISADGGLLRESHYLGTTYNPIQSDTDFSTIQNWTKSIIAK